MVGALCLAAELMLQVWLHEHHIVVKTVISLFMAVSAIPLVLFLVIPFCRRLRAHQ